MSFIEKLKWLWDTRTDEEKDYDDWNHHAPLMTRSQQLNVYIKNEKSPRVITFKRKDFVGGFGIIRVASDESLFNDVLGNWIKECFVNGIRIKSVWYGPESILRIELGEQTLKEEI